ncbi:MAG: hypothetical protein AAGA69_09320 [Pseudomonadota bacterium]
MRAMILGALGLAATSLPAQAQEWDFSADVGAELRTFFEDPAYPQQFETYQPSLILNAEAVYESASGKHQFVIAPFARVDGQDDERTHLDLREAYYRYAGDEIDILVGATKIFWGVTESRHLVDIINQTDAVEDIDEEDKLGQPMVKVSLLKDWGQLDLFVLPYFRERTFPGEDGRLRFPFVVDTDRVIYEDDDEEWHTDVAARYSNFFGNWDVGVSAFHGTSREPNLGVSQDPLTAQLDVVPLYDQITQVGIDAQYTKDAWLWKFEGIVREGQGDTFAAAVAGFEYTFFGVTESGADLGVLLEYLYDGRDEAFAPPTPQENDVFYGARYALNDIQDTSILAGAITDVEDGTTSGLIEAERRFGQNWKGELEARFFTNVDDRNLISAFEQDSALTLRLTRYF